MKIKTRNDAVRAAQKLGLDTDSVLSAFGFVVDALDALHKELADAIARKDADAMWLVHRNSPAGSPVKAKALEAMLADAIARKDADAMRWVYDTAPDGSLVKTEAIKALFEATGP